MASATLKRKPAVSNSPTRQEMLWLSIHGARQNNLKNIDVHIPLGRFVCITGVSGSGKSSLVNDILRESLMGRLNEAENVRPGEHDGIDGCEYLDKIIDIDQSPIGRTPRSNPATYIKVFDEIRDLFARLPDSKVRGYAPGRFSFNVATGEPGGGRCEACEGNGATRVEMDFLADVWATCPVCEGRRFNHETLQIHYRGKSIHEVLDMDVQDALRHFSEIPRIAHMLSTLHDVGLDYIKLGQSSTTLSGGEAQRIKLAKELVKRSTGRTLYILDEPTTGLHFEDIKRLLAVLHGFVDAGNSVLVIEHNLDVIKTADWIIDLGPEGGEGGGRIVAEGTPEDVANCKASYTGQSLRDVLFERKSRGSSRSFRAPEIRKPRSKTRNEIAVVGAKEHNLKDVTVRVPRGAMTVCSGVSGSGKTSFAIDTVYTEGHRRYVESLSAYARQFLGQLQKPKVDHVTGLSPAIAIEQKAASKSPRSTVGTVTEIYDYMRVLWARVGEPHCPQCKCPIGAQTSEEIVTRLLALPAGSKLLICAPVERGPGETWNALLARSRTQGYVRVRIDGEVHELSDSLSLDSRRKHQVELVVDRLIAGQSARGRLADSVEHALALGRGVILVDNDGAALRFSQHLSCMDCGTSYEKLTPHHFSFNARIGWCQRCEGLGIQRGAASDAILALPNESILSGGVAGWDDIENRPLLRAMLTALAGAIGFDARTPCCDLSSEERHALLFGLGKRWVAVPPTIGACGLRFQWKGFFPAIDEATKVSWQYRQKLQDLATDIPCPECRGGRIQPQPAAARLSGRTIVEVCGMPLSEAMDFFEKLKLDARRSRIAGELLHEIRSRLTFLLDVGLSYLTLGRSAPTLSGGESQRIRLASQIGSGLTGVLYVLDEPTIGLHPRDNGRLIRALHKLRDIGNTLLMVEHDREVIESSDYVIDFGPGAGSNGGYVVGSGSPTRLKREKSSLTGRYLAASKAIPVPTNRRSVAPERAWLTIRGARHNNLKNVSVAFPLGRFTCVTGVSGSGKSSLVTDILYPALAARLHRAAARPAAHEEILGLDQIDKVINVDQHPIGDSPLSNAATYTGVFDLVREVFARLPDSRVRGYTVNRFSFNRPGGRCDDCDGLGQVCYEMHFLPDVWVPCETCGGKRYQRETLEVQFKGKNIADVLEMSVSHALELFSNVPKVRRLLQTLEDVGLGYLPLGQSAPTLSGGEAQRVKLAAELGRPNTGRTVYILDEPTTGLHFDDLRKLLEVLQRLVDLGNTVICIEHNLDVIKTADWVIDLGPEAGDEGGHVVAEGVPESIVKVSASHTGRVLKPVLDAGPHQAREIVDPKKAAQMALEEMDMPAQVGEATMPWQRDGFRWHTEMRTSRDGKRVEWDGRALERTIRQIEKLGGKDLQPTNWNDRARVEVTGRSPEGIAQSAVPWFCHALTGGRWLLDLIFRVPQGTFRQHELLRILGLKSLDDRDDIAAYGQTAPVQVRPASESMEQVRVLVHSQKDVTTSAFREFLARAVSRYLSHISGLAANKEEVEPWKKDGKAWHLSQRSIPHTQNKQWKAMDLAAFIGRVQKSLPGVEVDWSGKVFVELNANGGKRIGKIITHQGDAIRVDLHVPSGSVAPTQVEHLGLRQELGRKGSSGAGLTFWFQTMDQVHSSQLSFALQAAAEGSGPG